MEKTKFATLINCMDGRVQIPVNEYIRKNYDIDYVDTITIPGPDKIIFESNDKVLLEFIKKCLEISINKHNSRLIALSGHCDCAGNPVSSETHIEHLKRAVSVLKSWFNNIEIIGIWVNEDWQVERVI